MINGIVGCLKTPPSRPVGRAVACPPRDDIVLAFPVVVPDGGQRSARPTFYGLFLAAALRCLIVVGLAVGDARAADSPAILYRSDFAKVALDQVPDDFLVLDGGFGVKEFEGKKVLELPGAPLDTFGVLFGPTTNSGVCVTANIYGVAKGRRYPVFGVGLNGVGGYKLKVAPAKGALEIHKGDDVLASVPFEWKSGSWTALRLQMRAEGGNWKIEGKAWPQTGTEPGAWTIVADEKTALAAGRASVWGSPYSGTPIRFDDLVLTRQ